MHEIGVTCGASCGARERDQECGQEQHEPRAAPQVPHDPVAIRDPEVPERRRRDDLHVDALGAHRLDGVADEQPGDVPLVARVRRRQDDHLHVRRRAKTIGAASASIAKAKK